MVKQVKQVFKDAKQNFFASPDANAPSHNSHAMFWVPNFEVVGFGPNSVVYQSQSEVQTLS